MKLIKNKIFLFIFFKALSKEEQYTTEIKEITQRLKEAEVRAENGERELNKLNAEVVRLEGI